MLLSRCGRRPRRSPRNIGRSARWTAAELVSTRAGSARTSSSRAPAARRLGSWPTFALGRQDADVLTRGRRAGLEARQTVGLTGSTTRLGAAARQRRHAAAGALSLLARVARRPARERIVAITTFISSVVQVAPRQRAGSRFGREDFPLRVRLSRRLRRLGWSGVSDCGRRRRLWRHRGGARARAAARRRARGGLGRPAASGFSMGLRKLWELVGIGTIAEGGRSRRLLAGGGVEVVQASVEAIDPDARDCPVRPGDVAGRFPGRGVGCRAAAGFGRRHGRAHVRRLGGGARAGGESDARGLRGRPRLLS